MRILTYNIHNGGVDHLQEIGQVIEQTSPDIVALQEANDVEVFNALATRLGFNSVLGVGNLGYHLGLLTRYPIVNWHNYGGTREFFHSLLQVELKLPGSELNIFVAHLQPGYFPANERHRLEEVEAILGYMEPKKDRNCVLLGDFNTISPLDVINLDKWPINQRARVLAQGGILSRDALQALQDAGLTDCFRALYPDSLLHPGHTLQAHLPNVRLDYIFANTLMARQLKNIQVWNKAPAGQASDHLPVLADFEI